MNYDNIIVPNYIFQKRGEEEYIQSDFTNVMQLPLKICIRYSHIFSKLILELPNFKLPTIGISDNNFGVQQP